MKSCNIQSRASHRGQRTPRVRLNCICLVLASVTWLAGCGRNASDEIDLGTIKNGVYQNGYFGFSVTIPTNWSVQDQKTQQQLTRRGVSMVAGDDKSLKASMNASELQSVNLLGAFKYPLGSPVTNNPAIMVVAESVRQLPGIQRGKDYLFHAKQLLQSGQLEVSFPGEIFTEKLNGADFDAMDVELLLNGRRVKEGQRKVLFNDQKGLRSEFCFHLRVRWGRAN